jgi:hypothetical protein
MSIPSIVISVLTFPGVIVHVSAELLFCRLAGIAVSDVRFFHFRNPAGSVTREPTSDFRKAFTVSMGPFFVNSALCVLFCATAFLPIWALKLLDPLAYFFYWLGISIGMHAFPASQDLKDLWPLLRAEARKRSLLAFASYPIVGVVYVLNLARVVWSDLAYGLAIGILLPLVIFKILV